MSINEMSEKLIESTDDDRVLSGGTYCRVLHLLPEDVIILSVEHLLSEASICRLKAQLKTEFPDNPVIVLDNGAKLSLVRRENIGDRKSSELGDVFI